MDGYGLLLQHLEIGLPGSTGFDGFTLPAHVERHGSL